MSLGSIVCTSFTKWPSPMSLQSITNGGWSRCSSYLVYAYDAISKQKPSSLPLFSWNTSMPNSNLCSGRQGREGQG